MGFMELYRGIVGKGHMGLYEVIYRHCGKEQFKHSMSSFFSFFMGVQKVAFVKGSA